MKKVISVILVIVMIVSGFYLGRELYYNFKQKDEMNRIYTIVHYDKETEDDGFTQEKFQQLKSENEDFVGYLEFESGLISQPVVQGPNNDYYLRRSFYGEYYDAGVPFMDSANSLDDMNIIIYGHDSLYDRSSMFSPINEILIHDYEEHSRFTLYTENDIREYEICYIYYINEDQYQDYVFNVPFVYEDRFDEWLQFPKEHNLIWSGHDIEYGNRFITLQTCKPWNPNTRTVLVAKEVLVRKYGGEKTDQ